MNRAINPYRSSQLPPSSRLDRTPRMVAQRWLEIATLCLYLGALANAAGMFFGPRSEPYSPPFSHSMTLFLLNALGISFAGVLVWAFGLRVIAGVSLLIYRILRMQTRVAWETWQNTMYAALCPLPWAAVGGLALWLVWTAAFFFLKLPGAPLYAFALSTFGHMLGAWVYGNVFWQWWKLARNSSHPVWERT